LGIHHVTAITADAQRNIDFYAGVLGLRLVKLTVNFDDPTSYHLYYGDGIGRPGTILTFFAWPGAARGRIGPPQVTVTRFQVPEGAFSFWRERLQGQGIASQPAASRFGEQAINFVDPDGLALEIVTTGKADSQGRQDGPTSDANAIRGFHGVTIAEEGYENTARVLTEVMGLQLVGSELNRFRYRTEKEGPGTIVDLLCVPDARRGSMGAGVVHHVAYRTPSDQEQGEWRRALVGRGFNVSPVMDRQYFHSIYYREPGGVLFEIATDGPGFTVDQPADELGKKLMLPRWLEGHRRELEKVLPAVKLPQ
jgi:catechol 2,3-dioxygenase-like lactoylglutathione lyase family enzyme